VRSLLDMRLGTVLKAYAVYWVLSLVLGVILLVVILASSGGGGSDSSGGQADIVTGRGDAVTLAQYRSVHTGALKRAIEARLGRPTTTRSPLQGQVPGVDQDCIGYDRAGREGSLFLFCFTGGRLSSKQTF
jgi:hypothetical protein